MRPESNWTSLLRFECSPVHNAVEIERIHTKHNSNEKKRVVAQRGGDKYGTSIFVCFSSEFHYADVVRFCKVQLMKIIDKHS